MRAAATVALLLALATPVRAYESGTTHPGLTGQAMLQSVRLHAFLRQDLGLGLGLFAHLSVTPSAVPRREARELQLRFARLDPAGGYRPDGKGGQRVAGWLMAGSVLAGVPASTEEDHFYSPVLRQGLDNTKAMVGCLLGALSVVEGGTGLRRFLTGTGFDLEGAPALDLVRAGGQFSQGRIYRELAEAVAAPEPAQREHHLVFGLLAMGGLLHVLQDLGSPTRVRNDFLPGHLQRLGSSSFDRGSAYERGVALAYGQQGIPRYQGQPIVRRRLVDFFSSADWRGLADRTAAESFSPGSVPPPVRILPTTNPDELRDHLQSRLPFSRPVLGKLDLRCARRQTCHLRDLRGRPLLAYRIDDEDQLRFFIDGACIAASARQLLPLAVGYSAGALDFLLRGRLELTRQDDGAIVLRNGEVPFRAGRLRLFVEDGKGLRRPLGSERKLDADAGQTLAATLPKLPEGTARLLALVEGVDLSGEPLLAAGQLLLAMPATRPAPFSATDIGVPSTRPATAPAAAPAAKPQPKKKPLKKRPRLDLVPKNP